MLALNRTAIIVRPKLPFLEWLHAADPTSATLTLADLALEPTIYLVPECADGEQERAALQTVFRTIFENQLDGWWRDRATWPSSRSFGKFSQWFDCQFHSTFARLDGRAAPRGALLNPTCTTFDVSGEFLDTTTSIRQAIRPRRSFRTGRRRAGRPLRGAARADGLTHQPEFLVTHGDSGRT